MYSATTYHPLRALFYTLDNQKLTGQVWSLASRNLGWWTLTRNYTIKVIIRVQHGSSGSNLNTGTKRLELRFSSLIYKRFHVFTHLPAPQAALRTEKHACAYLTEQCLAHNEHSDVCCCCYSRYYYLFPEESNLSSGKWKVSKSFFSKSDIEVKSQRWI